MNEPYCKKCGRYLGQFEFEHLLHWCERCHSKRAEEIATSLVADAGYYEAAADDLDSFAAAMAIGGADCSVESLTYGDPDGVYEALCYLDALAFSVIDTAATVEDAAELFQQFGGMALNPEYV